MRLMLSEVTKEERRRLLNAYRQLLRCCQSFADEQDLKEIRRAFKFALKAHQNARRKSGELYIFHPLEVAKIVVKEIGLEDTTAVICALLHDVVEDTFATIEDIRKSFGNTAANIIQGLTKVAGIFEPNTTKQLENFKRLLLTIGNDIRIVLIKIADRLHNMRTLQAMHETNRYKIASETLMLYAPLANRLGLQRIKRELEDLAFRYLHPEAYQRIVQKLNKVLEEQGSFIEAFIAPIKKRLDQSNIAHEIETRIKSPYSIFSKMQRKGIGFEEVYDLFAIRIVLTAPFKSRQEEIEACWQVYSIVTELYPPHPERLRDWLTIPRQNGYEALHTTVMSPTGQWVEVQIRTKRMHEIAEKGYAAHWKYKELSPHTLSFDRQLEQWIASIREFLEERNGAPDKTLEGLHKLIVAEHIYVFTPRGEIKVLPEGATALDFAYYIHTDIGHRAIAAKVNHQTVPLSTVLRNGDLVEIITTSNPHLAKPKAEWLEFVTTPRARKKIKEALKAERKRYIEKGKKKFKQFLRILKEREGIVLHEDHFIIKELLYTLNIDSMEEFYFRIGAMMIDKNRVKAFIKEKQKALELAKRLKSNERLQEKFERLLQRTRGVSSDELVISRRDDFHYRFASCCQPVLGDVIIAVDKPYQGIEIHRTDCPEANRLLSTYGSRIIKVRWNEDAQIEFLAAIRISGEDRVGMLRDLVHVISDEMGINIRAITIEATGPIFEGVIKLYVKSLEQIKELKQRLLKVQGVRRVRRIYQTHTLQSTMGSSG